MLTITHTALDGTMLEGTRKGDGAWDAIKEAQAVYKLRGWKYFPSIRAIGVRNSRDRAPDLFNINATAEVLRAAGFDVTVNIDNKPRPTAEVEAARADRATARAEHLSDKAARLTAKGEADWERTRQLRQLIPLGQPVMPDHYSYNRDMNFRDKLHRAEGRAIDTLKEGEDTARRAAAAEVNQSYRTTGPVTERRIKDLEAELRKLERTRDGHTRRFLNSRGEVYQLEEHPPATGEHLQRVLAGIAHTTEQIAYWKTHLEKLVADGSYRSWGPDDFTKGDFVRAGGCWREVVRVNRKSLTVTTGHSWTDTLPYDKVLGRRGAAETQNLDDPGGSAQ